MMRPGRHAPTDRSVPTIADKASHSSRTVCSAKSGLVPENAVLGSDTSELMQNRQSTIEWIKNMLSNRPRAKFGTH